MFNKDSTCRLTADEVREIARDLLGKMSLKEKVWLLNGNWDPLHNQIRHGVPYNPVPVSTNGCERLGVTPIHFTDGPRGIVMGHATCFPVSMARGASFDRDLERRVGDVIGKEARAQGANLFAGACINLLRHPAWGRAQETYSEDPYHLGEMGKALTERVQHHNVMVCLKHYALNNIENSRFSVNVLVDERTLREVYLPHFKTCVDAGAASVMGAYNRFRGAHCCESDYLLNTILREEWQFAGFTLSDFLFGIRDTKKAIEAGMDLELPMPVHYQQKLLTAVQNGEISEETVDQSVFNILYPLIVFENTLDPMIYSPDLVAHPDHINLAREVAEKSMVLIKNKGDVLPFSKSVRKVLVIGHLAKQPNTGDHGSSRTYAPYVVTPLAGIERYLGKKAEVLYCDETDLETAQQLAAGVDCVIIIAGYDFNDEGEYLIPDGDAPAATDVVSRGYRNQKMPLKASAIKLLSRFMISAPDSGAAAGGDRECLSLKHNDTHLIKQIGRINPNTVVVLVGGSAIITAEWDDDVPAILYSWYAGMEGGNALARLLFGDVNPGGKLPFSIPTDETHLPYFSNTDDEITFDLYHGYTLLDRKQLKAAYPFGHGLSYTTWRYRDLRLELKHDQIDVTVTLENTGDRAGAEVVQVYAGKPDSIIERQHKLLKGFEKIFVEAGQAVDITISVPADALRYYDETARGWRLEPGSYRFYVGGSASDAELLSLDIELIQTF